MKEFMNDLKIYHNWIGKNVLKDALKTFMPSAILVSIFIALHVSGIFVTLLPMLIMILGMCILANPFIYFMIFFEGRKEIKYAKKEIELRRKYKSLVNKFDKTY